MLTGLGQAFAMTNGAITYLPFFIQVVFEPKLLTTLSTERGLTDEAISFNRNGP